MRGPRWPNRVFNELGGSKKYLAAVPKEWPILFFANVTSLAQKPKDFTREMMAPFVSLVETHLPQEAEEEEQDGDTAFACRWARHGFVQAKVKGKGGTQGGGLLLVERLAPI